MLPDGGCHRGRICTGRLCGGLRRYHLLLERALRHDIAIQYDAAAQAPYYHYTDRGGREHAVWFEDARSIEAKLRLADEYHLQGVGYWNLTRPFPQNWAVLASLFDIETLL